MLQLVKYTYIMMVSKITEITIFESPDGGRTVYARTPGQDKRDLYSKDGILSADLENYSRWIEIFNNRRTNPALDDLCKQAEVIYELSKPSE